MRKLQITNKHRELINSVIIENPRFRGNEELINIFADAIYKKSYLLIDAIKDMSRLKRHLVMICDQCMEQIIGEKKKFDATKLYKQQVEKNREEVVNIRKKSLIKEASIEKQLENQRAPEVVNLKEELNRSEKYSAVDNLADPKESCPAKKINPNSLEKLIKIIKAVDTHYPHKRYYDIFTLRYMKCYNQTEIARSLKISQMELSKRFVELIKFAREYV